MYILNATAQYRRLLRGRGPEAALKAITADQQITPYDWYGRAARSVRGVAPVPQTLDRAYGPAVDPWNGVGL